MPHRRDALRTALALTALLMGTRAIAQDRPTGASVGTPGTTPVSALAAVTDGPAPASAPASAPAPAPAPLPLDEITVTDEVVDGVAVHRGRGVTVIHAPMEQVVRRMLDFARYPDFMPHVEESRVVHRNRALTDLYIRVPLTPALGVIWSLLRLETRRTPDRVEIVGQSVDGNMNHFEIQTVIERVPGTEPLTRFTFAVLAQPRLPFPAVVFSRENRDAARTVAGNLRTLAERTYALNGIQPAGTAAVAPVPPNAASQR